MSDQELVKRIIEENVYLSLATTDGELPWVAPVRYFVDDDLNFYSISSRNSRHMRHIRENETVAVAIFDSTQPVGEGTGVQIKGRARVLEEDEYPDFVPTDDMPEVNEVFMVEPLRFYIPDEEAWEEEHVDRRKEVDMDV